MQIQIPALSSGGLIFAYQCSNRCRHCLYASAPEWRDWADEATIDTMVEQLAGQRKFLTGIHIGGGEPLLRPKLIAYAIRKLNEYYIPVDYVETNAFWCYNDSKTEAVFNMLKDAGLHAILISVSPFHLEYVPKEKTDRAIRIASKIFGPDQVAIYTQYFYRQFEELDEKQTVPLEDYIQAIGEENAPMILASECNLIPNGRAAVSLESLFAKRPASTFWGETCKREITDPHHIHIDLYGHYTAGLCAGLSLGNAFDLSSLYQSVDLDERPLLKILYEEGIEALFKWAVEQHGYRERPEGYIAKCHLCLDIRRFLVRKGQLYPELAPLEFYQHLD